MKTFNTIVITILIVFAMYHLWNDENVEAIMNLVLVNMLLLLDERKL